MKTKKSEKSQETVAEKAPIAAKPLSKPVAAKAGKPVLTKVKSEEIVEIKEIKEAKEAKPVKKAKQKVVRDSFTMPQNEYLKIAEIKEKGLKGGLQVKKSEVLRAGVIALCAMDEAQLKTALSGLDKIKTGRPNKH